MTPDIAAELLSDLDAADRTTSTDDRLAQAGIIAALLEALNSPEAYQLIHRGGELFLEPAIEMRRSN